MPRGQDSRNHPNRRIQRTEGSQVGTYMGSVGGTHMFSSESTGGGETDSLSVTQGSQPGSNLVSGQKYSISGKTTDFVKPVTESRLRGTLVNSEKEASTETPWSGTLSSGQEIRGLGAKAYFEKEESTETPWSGTLSTGQEIRGLGAKKYFEKNKGD